MREVNTQFDTSWCGFSSVFTITADSRKASVHRVTVDNVDDRCIRNNCCSPRQSNGLISFLGVCIGIMHRKCLLNWRTSNCHWDTADKVGGMLLSYSLSPWIRATANNAEPGGADAEEDLGDAEQQWKCYKVLAHVHGQPSCLFKNRNLINNIKIIWFKNDRPSFMTEPVLSMYSVAEVLQWYMSNKVIESNFWIKIMKYMYS